MKKVLFYVVFFALFVSLTAAAFLGMGSSYLYRNDILWLDSAAIETTLEESVDQSVLSLRGLETELGMDLAQYFMEAKEEDPEKEDKISQELATKVFWLGMNEGWPSARAFADKYHVEYFVSHSEGRPLGGNASKQEIIAKGAKVHAISRVNPETGIREKYQVYVLFDKTEFQAKLSEDYRLLAFWIQNRFAVVAGFFISALLSLILFGIEILLTVRKDLEKERLLDKLPLDLLLVLGGVGTWVFFQNVMQLSKKSWSNLEELFINLCAMTLIPLILFFYTVWRVQRKGWHHESLVYLIYLGIRKLVLSWMEVFENLSLSWKFLLFEVVLCFLEAGIILILLPMENKTFLLLAVLGGMKLIMLPWIISHGVAMKRVKVVTKELAAGNLESHLEVEKMPRSMRELGENVNAMAGSISVAVEERLKSERLKTELITNVSHDIKTPLTSIINFSDMIQKEKSENEKITEYAEHLHKQSTRLKKLIEDLMEASKASTGNLEVHLEPCDVKVLLGQCLGEFEPRLQEKHLELVVRQGEEQLRIMADNRMLWRVFENLMNNICKYAQADTRVYLSAKEVDGQAQITFKNVSKYALDVAPEELMERFVRGDLSRHTEGSGLGLSIVSSLMELQGGKLKLSTDGDLFKAILEFPLITEN